MSSRSVTWDFVSIKTDSTHKCESTLEFEFLYHVEFDPLVSTFEAQPISLPYINDKGKKAKYTPDFKVTYTKKGAQQKGYKFSLVEIKYVRELEKVKDEFATRFKAAESYCQAEGGKFEVTDEQYIHSTRLEWYKFLHRYLDPSEAPKLNFDFMGLAKELKTFSPKDWVKRIDGSDLVKGQALSNLWHLVAIGQLQVDMNFPITMKPVIRIPDN